MMFKKKPICEECGEHEAVSFSYLKGPDYPGGKWKFTCYCTTNQERYYVPFDRYFNNTTNHIDWLAALHEKAWMNWYDFGDMIHRFRKETGIRES